MRRLSPVLSEELLATLKTVIENATREKKTLLRARIIYRDRHGASHEEVVIARRTGGRELRPLEAVWRVERLTEEGGRNGKFLWFDADGNPV